jgi:hypothetical protein
MAHALPIAAARDPRACKKMRAFLYQLLWCCCSNLAKLLERVADKLVELLERAADWADRKAADHL